MKTRIFIIIGLIGFLIFGWTYSLIIQHDLQEQNKVLESQAILSSVEARKEATVTEYLKIDTTEQEKVVALKTELLKARPGFLETIKNVKTVLDSASGKMDVSDEKNSVLEAQKTVLAATTVEEITKAGETVNATTEKIKAKIEAYEAEQEKLRQAEAARQAASKTTYTPTKKSTSSSGSTGSSGGSSSTAPTNAGGGWFATAQSILNAYGGGWVTLSSDIGQCGEVSSLACSAYQVIYVGPGIDRGYEYIRWVIVHELAHQYQYNVWSALMSSPTYASLYDNSGYAPIEKLANCMARARGITLNTNVCTPAMVNYAAGVWNGNV